MTSMLGLQRETTLHNGLTVNSAMLEDVHTVYDYFQHYFRHGVPVRPGNTIVDVGANIGLFAIEAFRRCGGQATIDAFEPLPHTVELLRVNITQHCPRAVTLIQSGASDHS